MNERHPQSPFSSVTAAAEGEVRMSDMALEQSNQAIRDLMPGQWAIGQPRSILFDMPSRRLLIDTFDEYEISATAEMVRNRPAIACVSKQDEETGKGVLSYVADLSHVRHLLYRQVHLGLDDLELDGHRLEPRTKNAGSRFLGGVVLREIGEIRYEGDEAYEQQAMTMTNQLNEYVEQLRLSGGSLLVPSMAPQFVDRPFVPELTQLGRGQGVSGEEEQE